MRKKERIFIYLLRATTLLEKKWVEKSTLLIRKYFKLGTSVLVYVIYSLFFFLMRLGSFYELSLCGTGEDLDSPSTNGRLLWDFLQQLLNDGTQRYTSYIQSKNKETGVFKIVDPAGLARYA